MYNRRYEKLFLMLRQETAGYGMGQRAPWGRCIMEIKNGHGKIYLSVQGLRPLQNGRYCVHVMTKNNVYTCGELFPQRNGYGEMSWEFYPENIDTQGEKIEDVKTIVVSADVGGGRGNASVPLVAYFQEKYNWRDLFRRWSAEAISDNMNLVAAESNSSPTQMQAQPQEGQAVEVKQMDIPESEVVEMIENAPPQVPAEEVMENEQATEDEMTQPQEVMEPQQMAQPQEVTQSRQITQGLDNGEIPPLDANEAEIHSQFWDLIQSFRKELEEVEAMPSPIVMPTMPNPAEPQVQPIVEPENMLAEELPEELLEETTTQNGVVIRFDSIDALLAELEAQAAETARRAEEAQRLLMEEQAQAEDLERRIEELRVLLEERQAQEANQPNGATIREDILFEDNWRVPIRIEPIPTQPISTEPVPTEAVPAQPNQVVGIQANEAARVASPTHTLTYELLVNCEDVTPFDQEERWKRISLEELALLNDVPISWLKEPFLMLAMKAYKHFIWREDEDGFFFGIPADYSWADEDAVKELGFEGFRTVADAEPFGYWMYQKK